MVSNYSLKSVKDLQTTDGIKSDAFLNITDICPTAALSIKTEIPNFICKLTETYDINDVFTPKINILSYDNKVINVNSIDTYIKDKNRIEVIHLPNRKTLKNNYQEVIDNLKQRILSNAHELNIFVVGDNIDLVSFSYLKILSEKFNNVRLCFNDFNIPNRSVLEIKRSELNSMDLVFFLGNVSHIDKLRFSLNQNKFRETLVLNIEEDHLKELSYEKFSKFKYPYLIVYSNIFRKYEPAFVWEKIQNLENDYFNKFGVNLNMRIIPQNLSQMLISQTDSYIPVTDLFSKFNKHDILSLCIIGNIDYELKIPEDTYAISNSVFKYTGYVHIPSKHYIEDESWYINIFRELLKTKRVINSNLKTNREFLFDLMENIFEDNFDSINDKVKRYIKNNFFEKYDIKYF